MSDTKVLLIYPKLGIFNEVIRDVPLSLIYAASHSVKKGYCVKILDLRFHGKKWKDAVDAEMQKGYTLVGLSVMTGIPIIDSLQISQYVKEKYGALVVWGGPHPTILPEQTLKNPYIDFIIRDWGSEALCHLLEYIDGTYPQEDIIGLGYKENGDIKFNPRSKKFEWLDFKDIPYDLADINANRYNRLKNEKLAFPIYTSMGCPWHCTFCMSPAAYEAIQGKKWQAYDIEFILGHIEFLADHYSIESFQDYADESFIDLNRMHLFLTRYVQKGFNKQYKLDFRGVRINDLDQMDDDYLSLMVKANVRMMFIGVESGCDRVLEIMGKSITKEQTLRVNRKLARYPSLKPHYNFFYGIPGETMDSLKETQLLIQQLVSDHPGCYIGGAGVHWKPIPGSKITEIAVKQYGYQLPNSLEEWAAIDTFDAASPVYPWYTKGMPGMINLLGLAGWFLDAKASDFSSSLGPVLGKLAYYSILLYRPFLRFRLKYALTQFLIEKNFLDLALKMIGHVI